VQLSEEKSVKTTINIKKENIISGVFVCPPPNSTQQFIISL
jgi:hypothetical protein